MQLAISPTAATPNVPAVESLSPALLAQNLESLSLGGETRSLLMQSSEHGRIDFRGGYLTLHSAGSQFDAEVTFAELQTLLRDAEQTQGPVILFGLGLGRLAQELKASTKSLVVFEPDVGLLKRRLSAGPLCLGDVPIVATEHDLMQVWTDLAKDRTGATLVAAPGYREAYPEAFAQLGASVEQLVNRTTANLNTYHLRAETWARDVVDNVDCLTQASPFLALERKLEGVPAFIVGAGPSLAKNVELLRDAAQKGIVIAVNSSAMALAKAGVTPQVLMCIESIDVSELLSKVPFIDEVARAFSLTGSPEVLRTGNGPLLPVYEALPEFEAPLRELMGTPGVKVSGSVSTAAFSLAEQLGCNPIVLVGHDLGYTGGEAYAKGTAYEGSRVEANAEAGVLELKWSQAVIEAHGKGQGAMHAHEQLLEVEAWGGEGSVLTGVMLSAVRAWFEGVGRELPRSRPDLQFINATEGGARIQGVREMRLGELLAGLPDRGLTAQELAQRAAAARPAVSAERVRAWAERQQDALSRVRRAGKQLRERANSALKSMRRESPGLVKKSFRKLSQAEEGYRKALAPLAMLDAYARREIDCIASAIEHDVQSEHSRAESSIESEVKITHAIERAMDRYESDLKRLVSRL
ncbi:MAG: motility associated factor glycosyltransferase family protein [Polyangiaceae bacterium]